MVKYPSRIFPEQKKTIYLTLIETQKCQEKLECKDVDCQISKLIDK